MGKRGAKKAVYRIAHTGSPVTDQPEQLGFDIFAEPQRKSEWPDPNEVREKLLTTLEQARQATDHCPWDARTFKYHKVVFPQMATWLPDDERDQLRFEFAQEVARIELLMAA